MPNLLHTTCNWTSCASDRLSRIGKPVTWYSAGHAASLCGLILVWIWIVMTPRIHHEEPFHGKPWETSIGIIVAVAHIQASNWKCLPVFAGHLLFSSDRSNRLSNHRGNCWFTIAIAVSHPGRDRFGWLSCIWDQLLGKVMLRPTRETSGGGVVRYCWKRRSVYRHTLQSEN